MSELIRSFNDKAIGLCMFIKLAETVRMNLTDMWIQGKMSFDEYKSSNELITLMCDHK